MEAMGGARPATLAMLLVGLVTAAACSLLPTEERGGQHAATVGDVVTWVHRPPPDPDEPGMLAIVTGSVEVVNGCVVLAQGDSGTSSPVVWPTGTELVAADPLRLVTPSGEVREGDVVNGGGGYLKPGVFSALTVDIPGECLPDTGEVAVFNPSGAVDIN